MLLTWPELVATFGMLVYLSPFCFATEGFVVTIAVPSDSSSSSGPLDIFITKLLESKYLRQSSSIRAATDLTEQPSKHHLLTQYIYRGGKNFNPRVIYLGADPMDPSIHLAVKTFAADVTLAREIMPKRERFQRWKGREGLLAMRPRSGEEPEFAGVLWLLKKETAKRMRWQKMFRFDQLQRGVHGLEVIERILHHQPV